MTFECDGRRAAAAGTAMGGDSYYISKLENLSVNGFPVHLWRTNAVHTDAAPRPFHAFPRGRSFWAGFKVDFERGSRLRPGGEM